MVNSRFSPNFHEASYLSVDVVVDGVNHPHVVRVIGLHLGAGGGEDVAGGDALEGGGQEIRLEHPGEENLATGFGEV